MPRTIMTICGNTNRLGLPGKYTLCAQCGEMVYLSDSTVAAFMQQDVGEDATLEPYCEKCGYAKINKEKIDVVDMWEKNTKLLGGLEMEAFDKYVKDNATYIKHDPNRCSYCTQPHTLMIKGQSVCSQECYDQNIEKHKEIRQHMYDHIKNNILAKAENESDYDRIKNGLEKWRKSWDQE